MPKVYAGQFPVNPTQQNPEIPLPKIEGYKEKDFASRRNYLDARARLAGYASYDKWLKARREINIPPGPGGRAKRARVKHLQYREGEVYIWEFWQGRSMVYFPQDLLIANAKHMQKIAESIPDDKYIRLHVQGNAYQSGDIVDKPSELPWVGTSLLTEEFFREEFLNDGSFLANVFKLFQIMPFTWEHKGEERTFHGLVQVHMGIWDRLHGNHRM